MYHKAIYIYLHIVIFCFQYNFVNLKSLIGANIKHAKENQFPSVVCLKEVWSHGNEKIRCTGTLISLSHVLTAEHCFAVLPNITSHIIIVIGSIKIEYGKKYYISWWLTFERWAAQVNESIIFPENDIAVTKLTETASEEIVPAIPSTFSLDQLHGQRVISAGFGQTNTGQFKGILDYVTLKIISKRKCNNIVSRIEQQKLVVDDNLLCTYVEPYSQLDAGDSGGPLFYGNNIVGVNMGNCPEMSNVFHPNKVNVHVNVALYLPFIQQALQT